MPKKKDTDNTELCPTCGQLRCPNEIQAILDKLPRGYVRQKLLNELRKRAAIPS